MLALLDQIIKTNLTTEIEHKSCSSLKCQTYQDVYSSVKNNWSIVWSEKLVGFKSP